MRDRVARDPDYAHVQICVRWSKFENFLADMGEQPDGKTLDRKNSLGDYTPENCRWATQQEQARNRTNNRMVTFQGKTMTLVAWAEHIGIPYKTLFSRVNQYSWPIEKALTAPVRHPGDLDEKTRT